MGCRNTAARHREQGIKYIPKKGGVTVTQEERREYLIETLLKEMPQYRYMDIPGGEEAR